MIHVMRFENPHVTESEKKALLSAMVHSSFFSSPGKKPASMSMPGTITLAAEVTHVSRHGFWLLLNDEELLVPFSEFPWFRQATIEQLSAVEWPSANHLYWPLLDVDLSVESIRHPQAFPLVSKAVG